MDVDGRCSFWLETKRRHCANSPLPSSNFCGNHNPTPTHHRIPCPLDPSHSVPANTLQSHLPRCPAKKQALSLQSQPFYRKAVNAGDSDVLVRSNDKRNAVYNMTLHRFWGLVGKIRSVHSEVRSRIKDSCDVDWDCDAWLRQHQERQLPFQEKHVKQQVGIMANMEAFGILKKAQEKVEVEMGCPALVEFGAGRGYLTQMLADVYGIKKVFLVERRSYKLKADRTLRQDKDMDLERLRIDIEDLDLQAVESLKGLPYLAIGKHICGPATDLTLRCCLSGQPDQVKITSSRDNCILEGLALATCCHHLCQWNHYTNKQFLADFGITKDDFHAITWFSSWAVDADHSCNLSDMNDEHEHPCTPIERRDSIEDECVEATIRNMKATERAMLGFICKDIIDVGRLLWLEQHDMEAALVKYVPSNVSPENHLLVAKFASRKSG